MEKPQSQSLFNVSSSHQFETCVVPVPITDLWPYIRNFEFDKLIPSRVSKVEFVSGEPGKVGSIVKKYFKDEAEWEFKILEISDLNYLITYEVVSANPPISATSIQSTIHLRRITDDNTTFFLWDSDFSNDAEIDFKEIKKVAQSLAKEMI